MNEDLLRDVAEQIRFEPETWNQKTWFNDNASCGTTRCIAGWTVFLGDPEKYKELHKLARGPRCSDNWSGWAKSAAMLLDIPMVDADRLFSGDGHPAHDMSVPEALEKYASGAPLVQVWSTVPQ